MNRIQNKYPLGLELGPIEKVIFEHTISSFAVISRDYNPLHFDPEVARKTIFGEPIAHGMLSACLFSGIFGNTNNEVAVYLEQTLKFLRPVYPYDLVVAKAVVIGYHPTKPDIVMFETTCTVNNVVVISGIATIWFQQLGD